MRCDGIESTRLLGAGDFFPDVIFEGPAGPVHTASLAGLRIAILFFPREPADACSDGYPLLLDTLSGYVPVMLAGFPGRQDTPGLAAGQFHELRSPVPERMFMGDGQPTPRLFLLERDGKISWAGPASDVESCLAAIADLIMDDGAAGSEPFAPVLTVRNALSRDMCRKLIRTYDESDNQIEGRVGLSNPEYDPSRKRVSHVNLDAEVGRTIDDSLVYTLLPMIERCFDFRATRRVAYKVSLYDSRDRGFFYPHRDNSDPGTDYRRYALSLALNDDWDGDGLSFPEFGSRRYRADGGSAIVFPPSLFHQVHPVRTGRRYVLLTFLYAEDGAQTRRAAMKNPGLLDSVYPDAIDPGLLRAYDETFAPESRFAPKYASDGGPAFVNTWKSSPEG